MEKLLPYAEALGVRLAIEMHGPWVPTTPVFQEYYELFERAQSEFIGVVPDFDGFRAFLTYTRNLHAKFIYVDDDLNSPGTDFHRLVGIMKEEGYDGFVASEYEGSFFDPTIDEVDQIRRHIRMMRQLWAEV